MKRKIIFVLITALFITAALCGCSQSTGGNTAGSIEGIGSEFSASGMQVPSFDVDGGNDFTILQITDTHLFSADHKKDLKTLTGIKDIINSTKPDMAVVLGDMIDGRNSKKYYNKKEALKAAAQVFEDANCYWAYVPGNNDGEYQGSNNDVLSLLSEYQHCIFACDENAGGAVQYSIDLTRGGKTVHSLIFLDSGAKTNGVYDAFDSKEVVWLDNTLKTKNNECSLFYHMNTDAFAAAMQSGTAYSGSYSKIDFEVYNPDSHNNSALDDVCAQSGKVGLCSIGHLHPEDNQCSFYNNTYYHITKPSGFKAADNPGASLVTIHTDSKTVKDMYSFKSIDLQIPNNKD